MVASYDAEPGGLIARLTKQSTSRCAYAVARALAGHRIYYCVDDGDDLARLVEAYLAEFTAAARG